MLHWTENQITSLANFWANLPFSFSLFVCWRSLLKASENKPFLFARPMNFIFFQIFGNTRIDTPSELERILTSAQSFCCHHLMMMMMLVRWVRIGIFNYFYNCSPCMHVSRMLCKLNSISRQRHKKEVNNVSQEWKGIKRRAFLCVFGDCMQ